MTTKYTSIDAFINELRLHHPTAIARRCLVDAVNVKAYGRTWGVTPLSGTWAGPDSVAEHIVSDNMALFWNSIAEARDAHSEAHSSPPGAAYHGDGVSYPRDRILPVERVWVYR